jgi:hypothetical protein
LGHDRTFRAWFFAEEVHFVFLLVLFELEKQGILIS